MVARQTVRKGNASFVNHPDRLTVPMIRRTGTAAPSWDEALSLVVSNLKISSKTWPDSVAFSPQQDVNENYVMMKLARAAFKTNNVDHCARLCHRRWDWRRSVPAR
jgi:predicted molibdopterin-dependent oxidoreductase YjgC